MHKLLPFPDLRQTYDFDCGACALQAVFEYYGIDVREDFIMKCAHTTHNGTCPEGIKKTAEKFNLDCNISSITIDDIKKHINKNIPVILDIQAWSTNPQCTDWQHDWKDGHYVIAIGYDNQKMYFEDPSTIGRDYLTIKELQSRWHDITQNGKKLYHCAIIIQAKKHHNFNPQEITHMD
jgi:ABC-type bacteriocin/lantibiotic exporter with double-glycine peptidase domain